MTPREVLQQRRGDRSFAPADADITALHAAGFRIVPMEPTAAMILAGCYAVDAVPEIYRAMLTAAEKEDGT